MSSTLAHEVNQPLAAIGNYIRAGLTMLDSENPEVVEKGRVAFEKAALQAERASDVVGNLRAFVRKGEAIRKPENLSVVIQDAITLAQLGSHRATIVQTQLSDEAEWAVVNRIQIQQVLVNPIRNAIEAMNGGRGQITVSDPPVRSGRIEVSVADNGPGLPRDAERRTSVQNVRHDKTAGRWASAWRSAGRSSRPMAEKSGRSRRPDEGAIFRFTVPGPTGANI